MLGSPIDIISLTSASSSGFSFSFWAPSFSQLFLILIWGIGATIILYCLYYFDKNENELKRALGLLSLFLTSMNGLVVSENLILLFVFWELTTLTSFLLIAHYFEVEDARASALRALYLTGAGGLALLLGILLVWDGAGTLSLAELFQSSYKMSPVAYALIAFGALCKSAQFPMHFWLPGAMAAPTPISAYLHSATMVKAGLFLLALLSPLYPEVAQYRLPLTLIAGVSACWGGICALSQRDLKSLLAYSTVSALGMILLTLSLGTATTLAAGALFILVHALYKGGLFLLVGWLDHTYHTRSTEKLGGLAKRHPFVMLIGLALCLAMASLPPALGYLAKELLYTTLYDHSKLALSFMFIASVLNATLAYRIFSSIFLGESQNPPAHPSAKMMAMPAVLAISSIALAFMSDSLTSKLLLPIGRELARTPFEVSLGWLPHTLSATILTLSTFALAAALIFLCQKSLWSSEYRRITLPSLARGFDHSIRGSLKLLHLIATSVFHGAHQRHLIMGLLGVLVFLGAGIWSAGESVIQLPALKENPEIWELTLFSLIALPIAAIPFIQGRVSALLIGGGAGLGICLLFALYSAPDLALTQLMVETLVLVMFIYSVQKLPKVSFTRSFAPHYMHLVIAASFATLLTLIVSSVSQSMSAEKIWHYYAEQSLLLAHGKNVVNVILVDFRALDTMGEITVLALASLGVFALLRPEERARVAHKFRENIWCVRIALVVITPLLILLSLYILLRGHNAPGGGFIGGLVAGIALILGEQSSRLGRPFRLIFIALSLSLISGLSSLLWGKNIFTGIWSVEIFAGLRIGSVLFFDLGVYLLVIGMVLLIARLLARQGPSPVRREVQK